MTAVLRIAPDHPACAGHFPGNPIIPGAWLLAEVVRLLAAAEGRDDTTVIVDSAKFFRPVRPGEGVDIDHTVSASGEIRFQCAVGGVKVMAGVIGGAAHAAGD
jgi:3-hydroxyacyl-[acyl-carrier-protein] dehydratase